MRSACLVRSGRQVRSARHVRARLAGRAPGQRGSARPEAVRRTRPGVARAGGSAGRRSRGLALRAG
ncbi:MAG TPA: hypothetical protein VKG80_00760 [Trebonia sp.]|nr:hypothetical protein [Trebonia sp.]